MFRYNRPQALSSKNKDIETRKFLTFYLANELYALDVLNVQEIAPYTHITNLANTPDFVKGICNLRGILIPVIDLRMIFNVPINGYNEFTVMIIIQVENRLLGLIVDNVSDVIDIPIDKITAGDRYSVINTNIVEGLGLYGDIVVVILDTKKLLSSDIYKVLDTAIADVQNAIRTKNDLPT